jgi:hypothetical protein
VDYEVSTPAVVKEGYLAPYRELAHFVTPTAEEVRQIESEMRRVRNVFQSVVLHQKFQDFRLFADSGTLFKDNYPLYEVLYKHSRNTGLNYDEKLILIKGFLDYAYPLLEEDKQKELFHTMKSNGISYTNRALHVSRSVEKYILSYSENRIRGAVDILKEEHKHFKGRLRALVLADFDKHVPAKRIRPGKSMGSATHIFHHLVRRLDHLDPVLVTGKRLYCDNDIAKGIVNEIRRIAKENALDIRVKIGREDGFAVIKGAGKHWKPSTYTLIVTQLFAEGMTKLLVGTRGIFGEGWDSLKLNTLIDLTAISFGTTIQQVRGRTLRLDPADKEKVSHNWDVACIYPGMLSQIRKMRRKHSLIYGIDDLGKITKGLDHLSSPIGTRFLSEGVEFYNNIDKTNAEMQNRMADRKKTHMLWRLGAVYEDRDTAVVKQKIHRKIVPVQTVGWLYLAMKAFIIMSLTGFVIFGLSTGSLGICLASMLLWFLFMIGVFALAYLFLLRNPVPEERVVTGIAKAVYHSMKNLKITDSSSTLKLTVSTAGETEVALYGKGTREFATALRELLSRPINPRYIILYDIAQPIEGLPGVYQIFVRLAEGVGIKRQYFAVPTYFAANRKRMDVFAAQWKIHVGGARFVYTRSKDGAEVLRRLVHSSMSDWLADVSAGVYWDYFYGKDRQKSRIIY